MAWQHSSKKKKLAWQHIHLVKQNLYMIIHGSRRRWILRSLWRILIFENTNKKLNFCKKKKKKNFLLIEFLKIFCEDWWGFDFFLHMILLEFKSLGLNPTGHWAFGPPIFFKPSFTKGQWAQNLLGWLFLY